MWIVQSSAQLSKEIATKSRANVNKRACFVAMTLNLMTKMDPHGPTPRVSLDIKRLCVRYHVKLWIMADDGDSSE